MQSSFEKSMLFFFWEVTPCGLVGRYQSFGETGEKMEAICSSETMVCACKSTLFKANIGDSLFL
jgi:hypothetical protein